MSKAGWLTSSFLCPRGEIKQKCEVVVFYLVVQASRLRHEMGHGTGETPAPRIRQIRTLHAK